MKKNPPPDRYDAHSTNPVVTKYTDVAHRIIAEFFRTFVLDFRLGGIIHCARFETHRKPEVHRLFPPPEPMTGNYASTHRVLPDSSWWALLT
jgi:hypothetical protein